MILETEIKKCKFNLFKHFQQFFVLRNIGKQRVRFLRKIEFLIINSSRPRGMYERSAF